MSMLEGLDSTLAEMGFVQLALIFLAVGAYSMAINGAFGAGARSGAASASFVAAVGFAALTPSWISGVVFLAVAVLAVAAFAAAAWASRRRSASAPSAASSSRSRKKRALRSVCRCRRPCARWRQASSARRSSGPGSRPTRGAPLGAKLLHPPCPRRSDATRPESRPMPRRPRFVFLLALTIAVLAVAGCATLPPPPERTPSTAVTDTRTSTLGRIAATSLAGSAPGESGFRLLPSGDFALEARLALVAPRRTLARCPVLPAPARRRRPALPARPGPAPRSAASASACSSTTSTPAARTSCSAASRRCRTSRCACSIRCRRAAARWSAACSSRCTSSAASTTGCTTSSSSPTTASRFRAAATSPTNTSCAAHRPTSSTWTWSRPGRSCASCRRCSTATGTASTRGRCESVVAGAPDGDAARAVSPSWRRERSPTCRSRRAVRSAALPVGVELDAGRVPLVFARAEVFADAPAKVDRDNRSETVSTVARSTLEAVNAARVEVLIASPYFIPGPIGPGDDERALAPMAFTSPSSPTGSAPPTSRSCTGATRATGASCCGSASRSTSSVPTSRAMPAPSATSASRSAACTRRSP